MSDTFCSKCGMLLRKHNHAGNYHNDFDYDDHYDKTYGHRYETCLCDRHLCDDHFKVRLGGLTNGINYRLRQLTGCKVKLSVDAGSETEKILAEICHVGSNYVEVKVLKKLSDSSFVTDEEEDLLEELEAELANLREEVDALEEEIEEMEDLQDEEEEWEEDKEDLDEDDFDEKIPHSRKKRYIRRKPKRNKFAIYPLHSVKWFEFQENY
ncbi:vacuolar-type H+-ATPase subunit I/STV1 [Salirhabdus euzebyi]|uniref:Vacuolar-type H+-ATPase subunit I/STV1 n=1 Tax=Salirhabdus euzebyi TaxID=394506 RepID=A0A841Q8Z2_9BACI|nr:hypothetical protein [Salirhabdus euzebyi]MBB6454784.1 vacuolar-type H+-ATPase subunit I/STV1 [Salirhabdus euzebyi]